MKQISLIITTACLLCLTWTGFSQYAWNAYSDFYFNSTHYANNSPGAPIPWPIEPTDAGSAWGYYLCNVNGYGFPTQIGSYFAPGNNTAAGQVLLALSPYQPLGPGQGQLGSVAGAADAWDATGGSGYARYGDNQGWGTVVGEYGGAWYAGAPGYGTAHASDTGLFLSPSYLGNPSAEGIGNVVSWTAPNTGTYSFSGSILVANNNTGCSYAIVDSLGGIEIARTTATPGAFIPFSFQKTFAAGDVVEFQFGSNFAPPNAIGFNCSIRLNQLTGMDTHWNAYSNFYFYSPTMTNFANNSPSARIPCPPRPSSLSQAWGYYACNVNLVSGYPAEIGTYFPPGGDFHQNQVLYAMSSWQPLGPGEGQVAGGVPGCQDAWDATPGSGFARYQGPTGLGSPVIGEYGGAWYPNAPGYGTSHANDTGLYLEPRWLGNPASEGIGCVITWTAPSDATYSFSGSFLVNGNLPGSDYAIVDSKGGIEVPKTVAVPGSFNTFSFQKTLKAGDVMQFQVASATNDAAPVGFNCDVQMVQLTDWNAYNDFYWATVPYTNNSPGTIPLFPRYPSLTGRSWGYYSANCNWYDGYPSDIGTYFPPGNNTAAGEVLYAMCDYQPLGPGQGQIAGGLVPGANGWMIAWNATGGSGFARYGDTNGWGVSLGEYGGAWFEAAPGWGSPHASDTGIWMQSAALDTTPGRGEGICAVVTWTAPVAATYTFNGSFLIGNNGTSGPDGAKCDYAIVDSVGGIEVPKSIVDQGSYNTFSFIKTFNAGDVVQFQVGTDHQIGAAVGFNCTITTNPAPAMLVSASRPSNNPQEVVVKFDAPLYAPTANNPANYAINNGITVMAAQLSPTDSTTVILTVRPGIDYPSVLTVNNVANDFGHLPVAPNSTATISVPLYVPSGFGTPTAGVEDIFTGSALGPNWQIGAVNYDNSQSNYYYSKVFVVSNGVLHCHASSNSLSGDLNYLIYVDPAYQGSTEEALMHFTIKASSFSGTGVAGVGVCVDANPWFSTPPGGDCLRAVNAGYAGVTNYPFFLTCSDYIVDNNTNGEPYNLQWKVGGSYWLRIRQDDAANGGIISTKAWLGDGSQAEPTSWQSVWKDPCGVTRVGYAAIRAGYGTGVTMDFDVDYFLVTAAGLPTISPKLPASLAPVVDLGIALNGANATLSWPAAVGNSFKLQSTGALPSGWTNVTTSVIALDNRNTVTVTRSGQRQFFRLSQ